VRLALGLGWPLYGLGVVGAGWLLWANAVADTSLARIEAPAAPALELDPGTYSLEPAAGARVYLLASRELLDLHTSADGNEAGATFEVTKRGVYVVELLTPGERSAVRQRSMLAVSTPALVAAAGAPLLTLPGLFLLAGRRASESVRVNLGGSTYNVVSVRRRLLGVVLDLVGISGMMILLLLSGPFFPPLTPFFPLAPLAYGWAGNARGRTLGKWLAGTRVVSAGGGPLGAVDGLIRTLGGGAAWGLFGTGYALATLHPLRRAPHDLLSRSYVVYD
jgi:hypothetical protein